jgi:hypothetical protein
LIFDNVTAASRKIFFSNADDARGLYSSPLVNSYIEVTEGFAEISQRADVKLRNEETKNQEPKKQEPKNREPKG